MRADIFLVEQGYAETHAEAQDAILSGKVISDGRPVTSPSQRLNETCRVKYLRSSGFVSQGALQLAGALRHFDLSPFRRVCLDIGAGAGGFSQVLLARGAAKVIALDIGEGKLHAKIASDPRLVNLERTDARDITGKHVPAPPQAIIADLPLAGLKPALYPALEIAAGEAWLVVLARPPFEIVDARVDLAEWFSQDCGWRVLGTLESRDSFFIAASKP